MGDSTPSSAAGFSVPRATYRFQFHAGFRLGEAVALVPYLSELGISHVYASPLFKARPGSTHGYDVCDPTILNPEVGTDEDFEALARALQSHGMSLLLDIVPNHMGVDSTNEWWVDVLENGPTSQFAGYFDIDWNVPTSILRGKVLVPVLGGRYGDVLGKGELELRFENGRFQIAYHDKRFPLSPDSSQSLLRELEGQTPSTSEAAAAALSGVLAKYKVTPGQPENRRRLHRLLAEQHYRLAYWRLGPEQINYRRFFDITDLVAMKVESPPVFDATHALLFRWLKSGNVSGARVDHPDGLWDPKGYLEQLQSKYRSLAANGESLYILVEKILSEGELLPDDWPAAGTTGYDYLNFANGIFVEPLNEAEFSRFYREFTGRTSDYADVVYESKRQVLAASFIGEMNALAWLLTKISQATIEGQDFSERELGEALAAVIATFPIYRTYIRGEGESPSAAETEFISRAMAHAKRRCPEIEAGLFDFIERLLLGKLEEELEPERFRFLMKLQQISGPAMAKGLEDTTFYRYFRLVSLNEVGGHPGQFGVTPEEFHHHNAVKQQRWPHAMLASATHDTKRGEDVRARINVLSELPREWKAAVERWATTNGASAGELAPTRNDEYLFYQTLVGAWERPCGTVEGLASLRERIRAYMLKAIREAKLKTSWTEQNHEYEKAVGIFVDRVLARPNSPFLEDFQQFQARIAFFGHFNSLSQLLLKLASPGVPDFYQGTELWDFSLVDPDNRRPVDFERRKDLLRDMPDRAGSPERLQKLLATAETGEIKLALTKLALEFRREHRGLFDSGDYAPLQASGSKARHVLAFSRKSPEGELVVVAPRLVATLLRGEQAAPCGDGVWEGTQVELPENSREYTQIFTNERLKPSGGSFRVGQILRTLPVALLFSAEDSG